MDAEIANVPAHYTKSESKSGDASHELFGRRAARKQTKTVLILQVKHAMPEPFELTIDVGLKMFLCELLFIVNTKG